jgi:excisionase family DNA binding protein
MSAVASPNSQRYLRPEQVAEMVGVGRDTLSRWVDKGIFPSPVKFNSRVFRWEREVVERFLAERQGGDCA